MSGRVSAEETRHGWVDIEINLLKWIATPQGAMAGFVGGDVVGPFSGQVLDARLSPDGRFFLLEALYEVKAGSQSFTARIKGQQSLTTNTAVLDGVVTHGWLNGAAVHVEYDAIGNCGKPDAIDDTCYLGAIHILARPGQDGHGRH
jgi:hypothetical protein